MKWMLCELLALSTLSVVGKEVRLLDVIIPQQKFVQSDALLQCIFEIKTPTELYSVTWYKDNNEFYRYLPRDMPPARAFPLPGVKVDPGQDGHKFQCLRLQANRMFSFLEDEGDGVIERLEFASMLTWLETREQFQLEASDEQKVLLRNLETTSSGIYVCEVSAEAPIFHTVSGQGTLIVDTKDIEHAEFAIKPRISGLRGLYSVGDIVTANCTVPQPKSRPLRIEWFVNDMKAAPQWTTDYSRQLKQEKVNTLGLKVLASNLTFPGRVLNLRCVAYFGSRKEEQHRWTFLITSPHTSGAWRWQTMGSMPICSLLAVAAAVATFP